MNTLAELVGTQEEIEKGTWVRAQVWPLIERLQAPEGAIKIQEGDFKHSYVERIRKLNNAGAWAVFAQYLKRVIDEDGKPSMRAGRYIAKTMQMKKNRNPADWTQEAQARYALKIAQEDERAVQTAQFLALPSLSGTEKQVTWATTLREKARGLAEELCAVDEFETLAKSREGKTAKFWINNRNHTDLFALFYWTIEHDEVKPFVNYYWHDLMPWRKMTPEEREHSKARREEFKAVLASVRKSKYARKKTW